MPTKQRVSIRNIQKAHKIINPVFKNSPQYVCDVLGDYLGVRLILK
jgi:hypothetical protein